MSNTDPNRTHLTNQNLAIESGGSACEAPSVTEQTVIFGVLVYLWLYNAPSRVSYLGSSLVRLLYPAEDGKSTLSLISSSAGE